MMNIEWETRMQTSEAAQEIVEPFRRIVSTAMQRVREGDIDSLSRQRVALSHDASRRVYLVSDVSVERSGLLGRTIKSTGYLDGGLFVEGIQLDESGTPVGELVAIQIPREVPRTTQESLFLQRSSNPEDADRLANELTSARKVNQDVYNNALKTLRESREEAQNPLN